MAREEHGVTNYTIAYAIVKIAFANGDVCCNGCEFCFKEHSMDRCRCRLLKDEIIPTDCIKFGVLPDCPATKLIELKRRLEQWESQS